MLKQPDEVKASRREHEEAELPRAAPRRVQRLVEHFGSGLARALARIDLPLLPEGFEARNGLPIVFIGNHRSLFDVFLGMRMIRRWNTPARLMVKGDFFERPGLSLLLRLLGAISVTPGRGALRGFDQAALALRNGESIIIMPEARIVPPEERPEGTGDLVSTLGRLVAVGPCLVVVNGLIGADDVWASGASFPHVRPWRRPRVKIRSVAIPDLHLMAHRETTAFLQTELRAILKRMEPSAAALSSDPVPAGISHA